MKRIGMVVFALALASCGDGVTQPEALDPADVGPSFATVAIRAQGTVVFVNLAEKHGAIERSDDGSGAAYQFNIPGDTGGWVPTVGASVSFTVDPENSRHATDVGGGGCIPPCGDI